MKFLILPLWFFLITTVSYAQGDCNCSSDEDYQKMLRESLTGVEYHNPVAGFEGVQFLRDWAYGEIKLNDGTVISDIILRYDLFLDEVLWLRSKDYRKGVLNKSEINQFTIYKDGLYAEALFVKKRIRLPYLDTTEVFVNEMVQGTLEFFAYRNVKSEPVANKLYDDTRHIISTKDKDYPIRLRRKSLLEMPFINETEMKKILRRNHIILRDNEQGMAMAIRFYNQLEL